MIEIVQNTRGGDFPVTTEEQRLLCECLISNVNLNNDTRVYVFVKVWMVLLDKVFVGSVDVCLCCGIGNAEDFIGCASALRW